MFIFGFLKNRIQYHHCMKKYLLFLICTVLIFSCSHKKPVAGNTEEVMDIHEFIDLFHSIKPPYEFSDTIFMHRRGDSLLRYKSITQFVPDSVFSAHFGKTVKPKIYPLGKVLVKRNESYLFIKAISPTKKIAYVLCFDKTNKFVAALPLININADADPSVNYIASIDNKYTILTTRQHKTADGELMYRKLAYVFNSAGVFTLILTESNEVRSKNTQIYNPIDTLARKHKFSADYAQDKRNFISVRDGKNPSYAIIFVHFEKDNGECKGELKGQAKFISATTARYSSNGDPCLVEFSFSPAGVRMKELEGCGNHRDIKCFFDGFYERKKEVAKKKEVKQKPVKKKTK